MVFSRGHVTSPNTQVHLLYTCPCMMGSVLAHAQIVGTGAAVFKVSPWALKLWQGTRQGFFLHTPPPCNTPPSRKNITRASPGRSRGETWSGREARIHHNNSCFQITTTWGRVVGYILWVERDHGCSFIYLHSQHWGVCVCVLVCVCDKLSHSSLSTFTGTRLRSLVTLQSSETSATASHVCRWWVCKNNQFHASKYYNECMKHRKSYWVGLMPFTFPFTRFHRCHFSTGTIMLRAISYFKYANINAGQPQTVHVQKICRLSRDNPCLCRANSLFKI